MSFATTHCRAAIGIQAPLVTVETHLANGLPSFTIVGLPEKAVQESRDRVRSALRIGEQALPELVPGASEHVAVDGTGDPGGVGAA